MNVVFAGTPSFALPALRALAGDKGGPFAVPLVLTRPDAASGRGKTPLPSPVARCAEELGIPCLRPRSFFRTAEGDAAAGGAAGTGGAARGSTEGREEGQGKVPLFNMRGERLVDAELLARIAAAGPDFIVVAAYGAILPRQVLELPRYGCVNIHASLLPRWRGAAPIQRAILAGDERAGVCIMRMEEGLDTGPFCAAASTPVAGKDARELTCELAVLGAGLLMDALPRIAAGDAPWQEQDEAQVTYAEKVGKRELALDPADTAATNLRRIRASTSQAPARCVLAGRPVTAVEAGEQARPVRGALLPQGTAVFLEGRLVLFAADGAFELVALKPDGKKEMPAAAFALGIKEFQDRALGGQQAQQAQGKASAGIAPSGHAAATWGRDPA
ncbi:MAG: methionyl-tRNA formyltransferase [Coriobacteriales bacterium]|jgi:methionyl-tRNA formyltransferase|nr:methionyl-tRNA formyltransferase [Coriobacteriales bacterium]